MRRAAALLLALALPGCTGGSEPGAPPAPPRSPQDAVRAAWAVAALEDPTPDQLRAVFSAAPLARQTARLLDLLAALRPLRPEIEKTVPLPGLDETAVDLSAPLPSGGRTALRLHARSEADGTWRVTWIAGPAGSWPIPEKPAL